MKEFLISILLSLIGITCIHTQQNDGNFAKVISENKVIVETNVIKPESDNLVSVSEFNYKQTDKWRKYKLLRAIGWTAFGIGVPALLLPPVGVIISGFSGGASSYNWTLMIPGAVLTLASIPILINANRYRDKAKSMSFTLTSINVPKIDNRLAFSPAVGFSVRF